MLDILPLSDIGANNGRLVIAKNANLSKVRHYNFEGFGCFEGMLVTFFDQPTMPPSNQSLVTKTACANDDKISANRPPCPFSSYELNRRYQFHSLNNSNDHSTITQIKLNLESDQIISIKHEHALPQNDKAFLISEKKHAFWVQ